MSIELKQAAQRALAALENSQPHPSDPFIGLTKQDFIDHEETISQLRGAIWQAEAQTDKPVVKNERMVMVGSAALRMVRNALQRDADNGMRIRAEMLAALDADTHPAPSVPAVPMTPASRDVIMATRTANADADEWPEPWAYRRGWNDAEAHHFGIKPKEQA